MPLTDYKGEAPSSTATAAHDMRQFAHIITAQHAIVTQQLATLPAEFRARFQEPINIQHSATELLLGVCNRTLSDAKTGGNDAKAYLTTFDLIAIAQQILDSFAPQAAAKSTKAAPLTLSLEHNIDDQVFYINIDKMLLQRSLINLISNALKFTNVGSIKIKFTFDGKKNLEFAVIDTGMGMTSVELGRIFQPFVQANAEIANTHGGTGLGLTNVAEFVKQMHGTLRAPTSEKDQGSEFSFSIPCDTLSSNIKLKTDLTNKTAAKPNPRAKVLIVDDNILNQKILYRMLIKKYDCIVVNNGREAVEYLAQHSDINIVLMDTAMPVMDGIDAIKAIRKFPSDIPIISISGNAATNDQMKALAAGATVYLPKPYESKALLELIEQHIKQLKTLTAAAVLPLASTASGDQKHALATATAVVPAAAAFAATPLALPSQATGTPPGSAGGRASGSPLTATLPVLAVPAVITTTSAASSPDGTPAPTTRTMSRDEENRVPQTPIAGPVYNCTCCGYRLAFFPLPPTRSIASVVPAPGVVTAPQPR